MAKKKGNLKLVFLIFIVIELALVFLSSGFSKKLEIGLDQGKFVVRHAFNHYDLQDKITEDFQRDEFLIKNTKLHLYEIEKEEEKGKFKQFTGYLAGDNIIMKKAFSLMNLKLQNLINDRNTKWNEDDKSELINEFNKNVISNPKFYEAGYHEYIKEHTSETAYILSELKQKPPVLSLLDNYRLNRIIVEGVIPENVLSRQQHLPRIYGSFTVYNFFRKIFGEVSALSAFYLIRMLLIVDLIFLLLIVLVKKSLSAKPSKGQLIFEMIYQIFDDFVTDTLGAERSNYTPYIVTIFLFIWLSNMMGLIPIPGFQEPTRNINVPLGMGLIAVFVVHFTAIRVKGLWGHMEKYVNPVKNPLAALDVVSEVSKVISISFRLFGNVLGGAIIIVVVSSLINYIVFPVGLNMFFGMFVGTVQAFVFTMLSLTYIGVEIAE